MELSQPVERVGVDGVTSVLFLEGHVRGRPVRLNENSGPPADQRVMTKQPALPALETLPLNPDGFI